MVASSATLALRSAGLRARAFPLSHRPSTCYTRTAVQLQSSLRCYSDAKPETGEAAKEASAKGAPPKETPKQEAPKEAPKEVPQEAPKKGGRKSRKLLGTSLALALLVGYVYGTDTRASIHRYGLVPLIRWIYPDAEDAHHSGVDTLKQLYRFGLHPRERGNPDGDGMLSTEVKRWISFVSGKFLLAFNA